MAVTASQSTLTGLPRRPVQADIIPDEDVQKASEAARKEKMPLVAYMVSDLVADQDERNNK